MRKMQGVHFSLGLVLILLHSAGSQGAGSGQVKRVSGPVPSAPALRPDFGKAPLYFIPNQGQVADQALFYARASRYTLWMTKEGLVFDSAAKSDGAPRTKIRDVSRLLFLGAAPGMRVEAVEQAEHKVNYLIGNGTSKWRKDIPTSLAVVYKNLYRNIDLKVYGIEKEVEYDWTVKPGGRVEDIRFEYENVQAAEIDREGNLLITTRFGELVHRRPVCYQIKEGEKETLEAGFLRIAGKVFGFSVQAYDKTLPLVIDPVVVYSSYLGGGAFDYAEAIAVDGTGAVYVAGETDSDDFPVKNAYQDEKRSDLSDCFITKFAPTGRSLVYSTYLGGYWGGERIRAIAVDSSGKACVSGQTNSFDFPRKNAIDESFSVGSYDDAFVTKLNSSGNDLVFSTYLGGQGTDIGYGIAVDKASNVYVTGLTKSKDFPRKNAFDGALGGYFDAFVVKIAAPGKPLIYSTYLGGTDSEEGSGIFVDGAGCALVTGYTSSKNYPVKNAFDGSFSGDPYYGTDAFLTKFSSTGKTLVFSTYLGGQGTEWGEDVVGDATGAVYVTGKTDSSDFPTKNPFDSTSNGSSDVYVAKFDPSGKNLVYSTYLGGKSIDEAAGIAVDGTGAVWVTGQTWSSDFPKKDFFDGTLGGYCDAFVTKVGPGGNLLVFSTFFGGTSSDYGLAIAVDKTGAAYLTGTTSSDNFPKKNAFDATFNGNNDGFMVKIK